MQLVKPGINIDFIGKRKIAFILSVLMIMISIGSLLIHKGPRYGIDFAGGTLVQVKFSAPVAIDRIKDGLAKMDMKASTIQQFGHVGDNEYLIRTDITTSAMEGLSETIENQLGRGYRCIGGTPAHGNGGAPGGSGFTRKSVVCHVLCPAFHHRVYFRPV